MDNKLKILNYLGKNIEENFTMRELSKGTAIPYATFHRTIKEMPDLVIKDRKGNTILVEIKTSNALTSYLAVSSIEEKREYLKKHPIIKKIDSEIDTTDIILLFGSYAKEKQIEKSDIDLLIINKHGKKSISFSKYEMLFKKKINPIFVTTKEFKDMLKSKEENVAKQALKNHIVLRNAQIFWEWVLNVQRTIY